MNIFLICIFGSLICAAVMGLVVMLTAARRTANQAFLVLSMVFAAYMTCFAAGATAHGEEDLVFWIRMTSAASTLVPWSLNLLRLSITTRQGWRTILRRSWLFHLLALGAIAVSQTRWFVIGAHLPLPGQNVGVPVYGPVLPFFSLYFIAALGILLHGFTRDLRRSSGMQRTELSFVLLASGFGVVFGVSFFLVPILSGNQELGQFLPLVVLVTDSFIAYGIATRRILDVPQVLSRVVAYLTLAGYLALVYAAAWIPTDWLVRSAIQTELPLAHFTAVLAVVFSVAPAHGRLQQFVNLVLGTSRAFDSQAVLARGLHVLRSISTLDELLAQFAGVIQAGVGTDRTVLLMRHDGVFEQVHPPSASPIVLAAGDPVARVLLQHREPLSADLLPRYAYSPLLAEAGMQLTALQTPVAVGIETKGSIDAIMLLGPRLTGRIYAKPELGTLQILANHLGVALENARLYTQVQDNAIYTKNLLEQLVTGVVAAGPDRRITVFNREAQRITGLPASEAMGQPIEKLPGPLAALLAKVFESGTGPRERETVLNQGANDNQLYVRAGSTLFHGSKGQLLGALLVFNDITAVKRLESQVRRGDRLASMGTLAAGMAHEIKNPLQTLKTFTQLLGERYEDPEFRGSFTDLVGSEVQRIDTIVNQLLRFARPAKPILVPMHLHAVADNTLRLLHQQMRQHNVVPIRELHAANDLICGDADLLQQAFVNFVLNAIDAMPGGGSLTISSEVIDHSKATHGAGSTQHANLWIRVSIRDTGHGIAAADLAHIFDPFYTTKSTGTGLGLSVSHGIITDHAALIDVDSVPHKGTSFHLLFPLQPDGAPGPA